MQRCHSVIDPERKVKQGGPCALEGRGRGSRHGHRNGGGNVVENDRIGERTAIVAGDRPVTSEASSCFHLVPEPARLTEPGDTDCAGPAVTVLEIPGAPVLLQALAGEAPRLFPIEARPERDALVLEAVERHHRARLVLLRLGPGDVRINGQPSPAVAVLNRGDILRLEDERSWRVAVYHRSRVGPAGARHAGKSCLICRTSIQPNGVIYTCPCGGVMHLEVATGGAGNTRKAGDGGKAA